MYLKTKEVQLIKDIEDLIPRVLLKYNKHSEIDVYIIDLEYLSKLLRNRNPTKQFKLKNLVISILRKFGYNAFMILRFKRGICYKYKILCSKKKEDLIALKKSATGIISIGEIEKEIF